jgi:protein-L-isoaspartate(D-aspartate) O-methyltransferase
MNIPEDELKFVLPRQMLVEEIKRQGITDEKVLHAIMNVPRHKFVDEGLEPYAYENRPLPIGGGQTISQPFTVAYMSQLLDLEPGMKVLEIGTGSGYQTAVLLEMGAKVYTLERIKNLYETTKKKLKESGYQPVYTGYGNGYEGLPEYAPYDRIIVTAAAPYIPDALVEQLKPGGKMVIPVGKNVQRMVRITKTEDGKIKEEIFDRFTFVPLLPGKE